MALGVCLRSRDRRRRAIVTRHERQFHADKLLGYRARLSWITGVVANFKHELFTQNATHCIDVGDRLFSAVLHLPPEASLITGHWARDAENDSSVAGRIHASGGLDNRRRRLGNRWRDDRDLAFLQ